MIKIKIIIIFIICICLNGYVIAEEISIKAKVENEIITNIDIANEVKYLIFLNPRLKKLEKFKLNNLARDSIINDIIKKKELEKKFDFDKSYRLVEIIEANLIKRKKIQNKSEFLKILKNYNLDYKTINSKLKIEALWNQLIYEKYFKNVKINNSELRTKILNDLDKREKKFEYNLSEIMFVENTNDKLENIIKKINTSLNEIGFENTANLYSISNTSKNGGLIGWINELQLSNKIKNEIRNLKVGKITNPINIQNGYLLIKLNDKREYKEQINIEDQLKKLIANEKNRQLNSFSNIFYKRLKKNVEIYDY
ncbi:MAG: peptidylprolyl isomerase [Candidatus Pelagibacter sp.]